MHTLRNNIASQRISRLSLHKPGSEAEELSVQVATVAKAVEDLTPVWTKWTHSLDTNIEYYLHNVRTDPTILSPYVITVYRGGIAQAMLVGLVRNKRVSVIIGSVSIPGPTARVLEFTKGARVGRQSSLIDKVIALHLSTVIRSGIVDMLCLQDLPLYSALLNQLHQVLRLGFKFQVTHTSYDSVLFLTARDGKPCPIFAGKSMREIRRKKRILQRAFPNRSRFRCFSDPDELNTGIHDAIVTAVGTWQYRVGCGLMDTLQVHETLQFFLKQGWLRIYVLYVDDLPCAFLIGQLYKNTFYCQYAGYDHKFARFSVGSLLTEWALENLAETGAQQVDLGHGNQEYHRRLGCQTCGEVQLQVFAPTLRGMWLNVFFSTTQIAQVAVHRISSRLRLVRIGRVWRDFLVTRSMRCQAP